MGLNVVWYVVMQHGTTQTSELINVTDFFNGHIAPDIQSADGKWYIHHQYVSLTAFKVLLYIINYVSFNIAQRWSETVASHVYYRIKYYLQQIISYVVLCCSEQTSSVESWCSQVHYGV